MAAAAFAHFLLHRELLSREQCEALLGGASSRGTRGQRANRHVRAVDAASSGLGLDLEDFLIGLCDVPRELVRSSNAACALRRSCTVADAQTRLCVNCVSCGEYQLPLAIARFVNELHGGFKLLNLRNDALRCVRAHLCVCGGTHDAAPAGRRRYDGIKYSVQKLEEVLYDLQIRKLAPAPGAAAAAPPP